MREAQFIQQNRDKWKDFETILTTKRKVHPDQLADLYIHVTDDLAYSRTYFPKSQTTTYLNGIAGKLHQKIYKNKRESKGRFITFWVHEVPLTVAKHQKTILYTLLFFLTFSIIGAVSAAHDENFVRLILGDGYVNMTIDNIKEGDPMGVYKKEDMLGMFFRITWNNVRVSFIAFAAGLFFSIGTVYVLFQNGIMLGSFQYFFYTYGVLRESFLTIWIHGTLEISAIVIAGAAGMVMGNSILFPGTYSRLQSLQKSAREALKIIIGLVPIFIIAGFLESFVTRHTEMPDIFRLMIILISLGIILFYFGYYPRVVAARVKRAQEEEDTSLPVSNSLA